MANRLQQLLMGGTGIPMPSVARSAMVEQLLTQAARQPIQAGTPIEGINIASKQILAALLARREQKAQQTQQQQQQQALANALGVGNLGQVNAQGVRGAGIAPQPGGVRAPGAGVPAGQGGGSPEQQALAALISGMDPQGIQGSLQMMMQQRLEQGQQRGDPFTLSSGQVRFDPSGRPIAALADEKTTEQPDQVNIRVAGQNGAGEIFAANIDPYTGVATAGNRTYQPGEYQRVSTSIQGTPDEVFPTEGERKSSLASRTLLSLEEAANDALNDNPDFDPTALFEARGDIPLIGNITASPGFQQYRAAADEWTANMVYLRSGTTARQDEKESAFQNFWYRVGDDEQTMPFKRRLRLEAMREAYIAGARANRIGSDEANEVLSEIDSSLAGLQQGASEPRVIDFNSLPQ